MEYFESLKKHFNEEDLFSRVNKIKILDVKLGYAEGSIKITENSLNPHGKVNGGLIFSLADIVAGIAAASHGRSCVTLNGSINYIKPGSGNFLYAYAEELKSGKTTAVYNVHIKDEQGHLVSESTFTMFYVNNNLGETIK